MVERIIYYIIPIVLLFVILGIFFGGSGVWESVKSAALKVKDILPEFGVGLESLSSNASLPEEHSSQIVHLGETINQMLGEGKEYCFANFGGFSELGEKGASLALEQVGDKTVLTVSSGAGGKQVITELRREFPKMVPCVIAGRSRVAENFFNFFVSGEKQLIYPFYQEVSSLQISYDTGRANGNRITVADFGQEAVNGESNNFESQGWLFTPDGKHICFFPTNFNVNYDQDGIANEWFAEDEDNSIPNKIQRGELKTC